MTWPSYVSVLATVHAWGTADHAGPPLPPVDSDLARDLLRDPYVSTPWD